MIVLQALSMALFHTVSIPSVIFIMLYFVGIALLFRKCGRPFWRAFVPGLRDMTLAECAGCEQEGRLMLVMTLIDRVASTVRLVIGEGSLLHTLLFGLELGLEIILFIYYIRVYAQLCDVFGTRRRWLILWLFLDWLPALIWGLLRKMQPHWSAQELHEETHVLSSDYAAAGMESGLCVDLKARTAGSLLKGKKTLLRDIHMSIEPGHMVLLLGGSGAGKTTLINAINGYEPADATVTLNGGDIYRDYKKMQYDIGFVPQQDLMRGSDFVEATLRNAAELRLPVALSGEARQKRVEEMMDLFGLTPVRSSQVDKLSGGQRKRLSIAMEFVSNPSLFILDEPDSGLDGIMARKMMQQLRMIADQGRIVIVITHTPDRVADLFDDVIVLAKDADRTGRLAFYGPIDAAKEFFGRDTMEQIVLSINRKEEGGEGRADEFIAKYAEVYHG